MKPEHYLCHPEKCGTRVSKGTRSPFEVRSAPQLESSDFSSFLLQAQSSKAKIVRLANAGEDTTNSIKQTAEFGTGRQGQKLAGLLMTISEVLGLGLDAAQGLVLTEDSTMIGDDQSRAFSERKAHRRMPMSVMRLVAFLAPRGERQ
jgi:ABC-type branched-subunit amino acid transport system substrate-binding protein